MFKKAPGTTRLGSHLSKKAVGVESAISTWGYGLDYGAGHQELMGNPTQLTLKQGETKTIYHGTLIGNIGSETLNDGVASLEKADAGLVAKNEQGETLELKADSSFTELRKIVEEIDAL